MRRAHTIRTAISLVALLAWTAAGLPAQTSSTQAKQPSKAAPPASKPASQAAGQAKQPSKAAKTKAPAKAAQPAAEQRVARRDPFEALVSKNRGGSGIPENLPPGKAGLMVSTLRLDGLVRAPNGMIAVVSNPQQRTYFLREGDKVYDGRVERITLEAATFHQTGKDPFGRPVERQVVKRLYPSPGESR